MSVITTKKSIFTTYGNLRVRVLEATDLQDPSQPAGRNGRSATGRRQVYVSIGICDDLVSAQSALESHPRGGVGDSAPRQQQGTTDTKIRCSSDDDPSAVPPHSPRQVDSSRRRSSFDNNGNNFYTTALLPFEPAAAMHFAEEFSYDGVYSSQSLVIYVHLIQQQRQLLHVTHSSHKRPIPVCIGYTCIPLERLEQNTPVRLISINQSINQLDSRSFILALTVIRLLFWTTARARCLIGEPMAPAHRRRVAGWLAQRCETGGQHPSLRSRYSTNNNILLQCIPL